MNVTRNEAPGEPVEPVVTYTAEFSQKEYDLLFLAADLQGNPLTEIPAHREDEFRDLYDELFDSLYDDEGTQDPFKDTKARLGL